MNHVISHQPSQPNLDVSDFQQTWSLRFWLITAITGIAAGLAGGVLMQVLHRVEHLAWHFREGTLLDAVSGVSATHRVFILCVAGLLVAVSGRIIFGVFGRSSDVDSAIWFRSGNVPLLPTLAQATESVVIVGMGTSLGRESAVKQAGGAIASQFARWSHLSRAENRVLVACGVGAGMAAAYNVPVGGALFAVEVLLGSIALRLALPALLCSVVATAASWVLLPTGPVYDVPEYPLSISLTLWSLVAGPLLGLATVPLVKAVAWAEAYKPQSGMKVFMLPIVVFALLGLVSIEYPQLLGNGQESVQLAFSAKFSVSLLLILPLLKAVATFGCVVSGARGGLFTPTMMIGALLGGLLGHAWDIIYPGASIGCCSVIGACAFLAAASQGPISALVLVLELTRHVDGTMVPMLLAVSGAMLVARQIESESIYSIRIYSGKPQTGLDVQTQPGGFQHLISQDFQSVSAATSYCDVLQILLNSEVEQPLYVVDHQGVLLGKIDRQSLKLSPRGPLPIEAAKAADVFVPVDAVELQLSVAAVLDRLANEDQSQIPVIESATHRLVGVVKKNRQS